MNISFVAAEKSFVKNVYAFQHSWTRWEANQVFILLSPIFFGCQSFDTYLTENGWQLFLDWRHNFHLKVWKILPRIPFQEWGKSRGRKDEQKAQRPLQSNHAECSTKSMVVAGNVVVTRSLSAIWETADTFWSFRLFFNVNILNHNFFRQTDAHDPLWGQTCNADKWLELHHEIKFLWVKHAHIQACQLYTQAHCGDGDRSLANVHPEERLDSFIRSLASNRRSRIIWHSPADQQLTMSS